MPKFAESLNEIIPALPETNSSHLNMDGKGRRLFPFGMASRQVRTARECIFNIIRSPWGPSKDEPLGPPTDTVDVSETVDATQTEVAGWCCWDRWEVKKSFFWSEDFQRVPFLTSMYHV